MPEYDRSNSTRRHSNERGIVFLGFLLLQDLTLRLWSHLPDLLELLTDKGLSGDRHFLDSACEYDDGWGFRFNPHWIARSQQALTGDWRGDWLQLQCPTLLLHGTRSRDMRTEDGRWMRANHPNCTYLEFSSGHTIHDELPDEFADAVKKFLRAKT